MSFAEVMGSGNCEYEIKRTWTATDDCGNTTNHVQTITVKDTEGPIITPTDPLLATLSNGQTLMVECDDIPIMNENDVMVRDDCDNNPTVEFIETVEMGDCLTDGFIYRMKCCWVAMDDCGNTTEFCIYVDVKDNTPPVISNVPPTIDIECGEEPGVNGMPTASDNCDNDVEFTFTDSEQSGNCPYTIVRTWTATDDCGNVSTATQTIRVNDTHTANHQFNVPPTIEYRMW